MISAKLSYRNEDSLAYRAFACSTLKFNASDELQDLLYCLKDLIEYEQYAENKMVIDELQREKRKKFQEWVALRQQIRDKKLENVCWMFMPKRIKEILTLYDRAEDLVDQNTCLELRIDEMERSSLYTAPELTERFHQLLLDLGFNCVSSKLDDSKLNTEIYESTCSDEDLMIQVKDMIANIRQQRLRHDHEM